MAAPPLPPKGSPNSWLKDNRVGEHESRTFLASGSSTQPPRRTSVFDQLPVNKSMLQGNAEVPPIPPRPLRNWNQTFDNELSMVPPPPSVSPVWKSTDFMTLPMRNVNTNFSCTNVNNTINGNFVTNYNTYQHSVFPTTSFVTNHVVRPVFVGQNPAAVRMPTAALGFANAAYQLAAVPSLSNGFDIHHSKSAPDLVKFGQNMLPVIHRSSIPNTGVNLMNTIPVPPRPSANALQNRSNNQANLEGVLKFMKKKRDSNLIDLYCSETESLDSKVRSSKKSHHDDILKLFDPLSESLEECSLSSIEDETKSISETIVKEIPFSIPHDVKDDLPRTTKPKVEFISKPSETIYATIQFDSSLPGSILKNTKRNVELHGFCEKLRKLRSEYSFDDHPTNAGVVISAALDSYQEEALSIKLIIFSSYSERPVSFTCDVTTSVEHIISHAVCSFFDDTSLLSMDNYTLKVFGLAEYFSAHSVLSDYEYVHQCHKFDKPVLMTLIDVKDLERSLARTKMDDINDIEFKVTDIASFRKRETINFDSLSILLETLEKEMEKLKGNALKLKGSDLCPQGVVQAVKAICTLLSHVETSEITDVVSSLIDVCLLFGKNEASDFEVLPECGDKNNCDSKLLEKIFPLLELSLQKVQQAVQKLLLLYTNSFNVDFEVKGAKKCFNSKSATDFLDTLLLQINILHGLSSGLTSQYSSFCFRCELLYGTHILAACYSKTISVTKSFFTHLSIEEWLQFESFPMCTLPRETVLRFTLFGTEVSQADDGTMPNTPVGWCGIRLFNYEDEMIQGGILLGLWPFDVPEDGGSLLSNPSNTSPLLQLSLPEYDCVIKFPVVVNNKFAESQKRKFSELPIEVQSAVTEIIDKDSLTPLKADEKELLWEKRNYLHEFPQALPKVLLSAHGWDWACLSDIYSLLKSWHPLSPVDALQLLLPVFPDRKVREMAVHWMKEIVSDELCDYLPQVIQALRYEAFDDSSSAFFLLERALTSIRIAHQTYWLLKQNSNDPLAGRRMRQIQNALLAITGKSFRESMNNQEQLLTNLSDLADKIKTTKDSIRLSVLLHELEGTHHCLIDSPTCLPLSPSLKVCGVDVKSCSYFTSNTLPIKINFLTPEKGAKNYEAIYKVGDDLRQDMITLQMIRIMDKLWLKNGLDLKIVTFMCVATDFKKGMVELVPESETLRKIHTDLGLTGSFKDRSISEWLQKYNTSELEYQQAVENFTLSCAGYCVATYILGICDRHNDNIMLKTSGHIFHIDFGKFLGDAQMFGNIKRDRTPFVLTSDMAYVINGGDKPSKKFQYFIDLCCQAFNIVRKHRGIFFNLFTLMVSSGVPGLSHNAVAYIRKALLPDLSEAEATAQFTRMIQESLKSWFTQFNFFIHNIAQRRFTGDHNDDLLLSFIPKVYSKETDGKITLASVIGYKKMYDPEKYYIYVVNIERLNLPVSSCIYRTYREFIEFHQKLCVMFPLAKFLPLRGNPLMGRTNIRDVADRRREELKIFLNSLFTMAEEISHCDLVYTFFHPMLRDQEGIEEAKEAKTTLTRARRGSSVSQSYGQIKLSIVYKNNSLFIMVMHAKNLNSPRGMVPDSYIKTYLVPDPNKLTKRKTKTMTKSYHPTFMEMLVYSLPYEVVVRRTLYLSVWSYDRVQENEFLGAALIPLSENNLHKENVEWYQLGSIHHH